MTTEETKKVEVVLRESKKLQWFLEFQWYIWEENLENTKKFCELFDMQKSIELNKIYEHSLNCKLFQKSEEKIDIKEKEMNEEMTENVEKEVKLVEEKKGEI